jgi:tRNA nucleotidyltransferase (CCA-adding enzyme)
MPEDENLLRRVVAPPEVLYIDSKVDVIVLGNISAGKINMDQLTRTIPAELIERISADGKLYEVGGSVRDSLINPGVEHKDRDYLIIGVPLDDLIAILRRFGQVDVVGKSFGVIKFAPVGSDSTFDIAIPRTEKSVGKAHTDFEVTYDPGLSVEVDLKRRDFTINAMAREVPSGTLIDPYGGVKDVNKKVIRVVFPDAIEEDPLRILRGAQFAARFEFRIESDTLQAMKAGTSLLNTISPERIADEINKMLLKADKPSIGFRYLLEIGALDIILPELIECVGVDQPGGYHKWDVFDHTMVCVDNAPRRLAVRLAALFHDVGKPQTREIVKDGATFYGHDRLSTRMTIEVLKRLRYSNEMIEQVSKQVSRHMFSDRAGEKGIRRLIRSIGKDLIYDLLDLRRADIVAQGMGQDPSEVDEFEAKVAEEIEKKPPFGLKDLAIGGDDIKSEFDVPEGPLVGQTLNDLLEMVLDDPSANVRETLLLRAKEFLAQKRS